ncbi:MAG: calcium-binding protein [Okeania sp. SIO3B3]|nr:calcium-binding protein [Okeania sp. SIO3B3]
MAEYQLSPIRGLIGDNWYSANQGNDILLIGTRDSLYGGRDNDTISIFTPEVVEALDFDTLPRFTGNTGQGQNFVSANRQDDLVVAFGDRDTIYGGKNNDTLYSLGSQVRLSGDNGNDTIVQLNQETVGTPVNSTAIALTSIERSTLLGGGGSDFIQGAVGPFGDGRNSLDGGAGNDTIRGQASRDTLAGGGGNDFIATGLLEENEDKFSTNGIAVSVPGFAGQNRLDGGAGDDTLASGFLSDTMIGGQGNDCLSGIFSRVDGGEGNDTIDATNISTEASGGGSIEVTLIGSSGNDILLGSTGDGVTNFFNGGTGNDLIQFGGTGDQLIGNTQGNDTVIAFQSESTAPFFIEDTQGSNTLSGANNSGDTLITGAGDDSIVGGTADDEGRDSISAGAGDDVIFGRGGRDTIVGGAGDDYIAPGLATGDSLIGGLGNDSFAYFSISDDSKNTVIVDFDPSDDRILLDLNGFGLENSSKNSIISNNDFVPVDRGQNYQDSDARDTTPVIIYERARLDQDGEEIDSGLLKYDPNGTEANDENNPIVTIARLNGNPDLDRTDIFII